MSSEIYWGTQRETEFIKGLGKHADPPLRITRLELLKSYLESLGKRAKVGFDLDFIKTFTELEIKKEESK